MPPAKTKTVTQDARWGNTVADLKKAFQDNLHYQLAKFPAVATRNDNYMALAYTVRDRMLRRWVATAQTYFEKAPKTVCYLSAEFLLGPHLGNNLLNLGLTETARQAMKELGINFESLLEQEEEPGLGNGGLGRLAACYLDSLATLQIPAIGYGIRYEFGIFDQAIHNCEQVEVTDKWLRFGNPWEIYRPEIMFHIGFGGHTEVIRDANGRQRTVWKPDHQVRGVAYDTPIPGYKVTTVNLLRLWQAQAAESFDFQAFNAGDYYGAVDQKVVSENITKVLYPNDSSMEGKVLRLQQQYFFASCSLQDMIRLYGQRSKGLHGFPQKFTAQLNDTHPSIAVAELMRLLVDEYMMSWDDAWEVTRQTFAYTNHTLLPEALEMWPLDMFGKLLPRHLEIIYEINRRFLIQVRAKYPNDDNRLRRMSLINEDGHRAVRMANLACVGSYAVNGVAELHSRLLREHVLRDFAEYEPEKFCNVTNGVTPRRFVALANPNLTAVITKAIGDRWIGDLDDLRKLEPLAKDRSFRAEWRKARRAAKAGLVALAKERVGLGVDADSLFDIQAKRFHEYKRQHLNILHVIAQYLRLKENPSLDIVPRTYVFGGKAAPGYFLAKLIIRLINGVAEVVNGDQTVAGRIRVLFVPDFNVTNAQPVYPAADLSEQISTAGKEASGTGNMKFSLNGALTIGTLDGANIEIRECVGEDNFFCFGLTTEEVAAWQARGYNPATILCEQPELTRVMNTINSGLFARGDATLYKPLVDNLCIHDPYFVLADFRDYADCQDKVSQAFRDREHWTRMSILNVARMGKFSSDRSIRDYCRNIWDVKPVPIAG